MIRLHIIEDHPIIIDGIRQRLRRQKEVLTIEGTSSNIADFIESTSADSFDIIVLDLWLPGTEPLENLQRIRNHFPMKPVVIFTQETNPYWIRAMMDNGASAYLFKNTDSREFIETLQWVMQGKTVAPDCLMPPPQTGANQSFQSPDYQLKPSEHAIVTLLAHGASLKTIATERVTTVSAIEKCLKKIRTAYGVSTNPELIRVLMTRRVI